MKAATSAVPCMALLLASSLVAPLTAQRDAGAHLASKSYQILAPDIASGGSTASAKYRLHGSFGSGIVASRASSKGFVLMGGSAAADQNLTTGKPILVAIQANRTDIDVQGRHDLLGIELALGAGTVVTVDGLSAKVQSTLRDRVSILLPALKRPGWVAVQVKNGGGVSTLDKGLAVRPFLDMPTPLRIGDPSIVVYEGSPGDVTVWILATGRLPTLIPIAPFRYGLGLNPISMVVLPPIVVSASSGQLRFPIPGIALKRPLYLQTLSLWKKAGYTEGSFSNVLSL